MTFTDSIANHEQVPPLFLDVHPDHFVLDSKYMLFSVQSINMAEDVVML